MATIQKEYLDEGLLSEVLPLMKHHSMEISGVELKVDVSKYLALQQLGLLYVFTARDNDRLVGYISYVVDNYINNTDVVIATQNGLFVETTNRGAFIGMRLIKESESILSSERGVNTVYQFFTDENKIDSMLTRLGYIPSEYVYRKDL